MNEAVVISCICLYSSDLSRISNLVTYHVSHATQVRVNASLDKQGNLKVFLDSSFSNFYHVLYTYSSKVGNRKVCYTMLGACTIIILLLVCQ